MKHLITIAFISTCLFSFGQLNMFWNNYSNLNPAMSGLQHVQHGAMSFGNFTPGFTTAQFSINGNYNMRLKGKHGVGINYGGDFYNQSNNRVVANYNYQFDLKKAGKLGVGTGIGIGRAMYREQFYDQFGISYYPSPYTYAHASIGVAYAWKNLLVGVSTNNLFSESNPALSSYSGYRLGMNANIAYNIPVGQSFDITSRALYQANNGFHQLRFNVTTTFQKKYSLGFSLNNRDNFGVNIGWDILEKFRVAYAFSQTFSKLTNGVSKGAHEFSIGYLIKNKPVNSKVVGTPNF